MRSPTENGNKKGNELDAQALREKALENLHTLRSLDAENDGDANAALDPEEEHLGMPCICSIGMNVAVNLIVIFARPGILISTISVKPS